MLNTISHQGNASQNNKIPLHTRTAIVKNIIIISVGKGVEKLELLYSAGETVK